VLRSRDDDTPDDDRTSVEALYGLVEPTRIGSTSPRKTEIVGNLICTTAGHTIRINKQLVERAKTSRDKVTTHFNLAKEPRARSTPNSSAKAERSITAVLWHTEGEQMHPRHSRMLPHFCSFKNLRFRTKIRLSLVVYSVQTLAPLDLFRDVRQRSSAFIQDTSGNGFYMGLSHAPFNFRFGINASVIKTTLAVEPS